MLALDESLLFVRFRLQLMVETRHNVTASSSVTAIYLVHYFDLVLTTAETDKTVSFGL